MALTLNEERSFRGFKNSLLGLTFRDKLLEQPGE
jgi:hypothetical protein